MISNHYKTCLYFSKLVQDYYGNLLDPIFKGEPPKIRSFKKQILLKQENFDPSTRIILTETLISQSKCVSNTSLKTFENIEKLSFNNTFSVTTGHQLNLFTGPLLLLYKIISTINLSKKLEYHYPQYNFVPLYWMATEDHDFEEINHFFFKGEKVNWEHSTKNSFAGTLPTKTLEKTYQLFSKNLGVSKKSSELKNLFKQAYLDHQNLSEATRYLINHFFSFYGLIILDANDFKLKKIATPLFEKELKNSVTYDSVMSQISNLKNKRYPIQQEPSQCNLFYNHNGARLKFIPKNDGFLLGKSDIFFPKKDCFKELRVYPEKFSPNVLLRTCYQETILPNLAYIGGGKELNYWFELKLLFKNLNIPFPILMLRNTVFLINSKQEQKLKKLNLHAINLLNDINPIINQNIKQKISISEVQKIENTIEKQLQLLSERYRGDGKMQEIILNKNKELLKRLHQLERRIISKNKRADSRIYTELFQLKNSLYPFDLMQERVLNFSEIYLTHGKEIIPKLLDKLDPFSEKILQIKI